MFLALIFLSCEVDDVPEIDNVPPVFSLKITGNGFDRTFTQEDNFEGLQLNLRSNTSYEYILTGGDQGGVRTISFQFSNETIQLESVIPDNWEVNDNGFSTTIQFSGDRDNPISGNILSGSFFTTGQFTGSNFLSDSFRLEVSDFGGAEGTTRNTTQAELNILIGEHETEVQSL